MVIPVKILITKLKSGEIFNQDAFESIKYQAYSFIDNHDYDGAVAFASSLDAQISQNKASTQNEAYYLNILNFWLIRLRLFCFANLSLSQQNALIKNSLATCLFSGLDIKKTIYNFFEFFESEVTIGDYAKSYISAANSNIELIGSKTSAFQAANFRPTVSNWLIEYSTVLNSKTVGLKTEPGAFHIVKFMDTNQYVKLLMPKEKEILKDLFDFYNWMLSPVAYEDNQKIPTYVTKEKFTLPPNLANSQPQPQPTPKPVQKPIDIEPKPAVNKIPPITQTSNINLNTGSGLKLTPPVTPKPKIDIDKKLEELKKKTVK